MSADARPALPRFAFFAVVGLVVSVLAATSTVRLGVLDPPKTAQVKRDEGGVVAVAARDLRFLDRRDGAVVIEDVTGARPAIVIAPKSNQGFIRGVMRGLARSRKMRGVGERPPFRLTLWQNGRLSLRDSVTGQVVELDSFGATNRAAFAALLTPPVRTAAR